MLADKYLWAEQGCTTIGSYLSYCAVRIISTQKERQIFVSLGGVVLSLLLPSSMDKIAYSSENVH